MYVHYNEVRRNVQYRGEGCGAYLGYVEEVLLLVEDLRGLVHQLHASHSLHHNTNN
jgi:hypothetical protein